MTTADYLESLQDDLDRTVTALELEEGTNFTDIADMAENGDISTGGGADLSEYFNNTITENRTTAVNWDYLKKIPDLIVSNNVTQLSYLFQRNKFKIWDNNVAVLPKVVCNNNVTNMSYMYYGANDCTSIDLSGLNTSNVTNMSHMFENVGKVTSLDLSEFNTSKVTNMASMFYSMTNLVSLDLSDFDFSKIKNLSSTFYGCSNLLSLDLSNLTGENFESSYTFNNTFSGCLKIAKIDLSNFNPLLSSADTRTMCYNCYKLEEIYLDKWDLGQYSLTGYYNNMFSNCGRDLENGTVTKVYVKDAAAQNWVLTASNGHPSTWTTDNVIIAGSAEDLRTA